jgi:unsaturated rhamnogalacturonyl hydrolase
MLYIQDEKKICLPHLSIFILYYQTILFKESAMQKKATLYNVQRISQLILISILLVSFSLTVPCVAQDTSETIKKLRALADGVLKDAAFQFVDSNAGIRYKSTENAPQRVKLSFVSPYNDWRYWNGVLNIAMLKLSDMLNEPAYSGFALKNIAFCFDNYRYFEKKHRGEDKWSYPFGQYFIMNELDDCGAIGASVIEVYRLTKQDRYKIYIDKAAKHVLTGQSRLDDGTLVRSFPQKWTLWADDLYMGLSFLTRMGELTNDKKYFDDAAKQVINFHKYLFDEEAGLMHHCWYSTSSKQSVAFWGRANGWAIVAQVDLLDRLPKNHPERGTLLALLKKHISGISRYQSADGLWHQLLDKPDSYLETSCSAMFSYAIARAVNAGYIAPHSYSIAEKGWKGVMSKIDADGKVEGICAGTVVSEDLNYYYQRPTPLNDIHGVATVLLAGTEILHLSKRITCQKCH